MTIAQVQKQTRMHVRDILAGAPEGFELKNDWLRYQIGKVWSPNTPYQTFQLIAYGKDLESAVEMFERRQEKKLATATSAAAAALPVSVQQKVETNVLTMAAEPEKVAAEVEVT